MFGRRKQDRDEPEEERDPSLWQPVALKDGNPQTFTYLSIEEISEAEVTARVHRWPRVGPSGRLELQPLCTLRAAPIRRRSLVRRGRYVVDLKHGLHVRSRVPLDSGDLLAGSPTDSSFFEDPEDLDDWERFSRPLIRITDESKEVVDASFEPYAWTLYRDWLGQAPLIAHFARLAREQLSPDGHDPADLSIEARVDEDSEYFVTPEDYLNLASPQALEKPDSVLVKVDAGQAWIHIHIARRRDRTSNWLNNAVLLEVGSREPSRMQEVARIHKRMAAAVQRGEPKWGAKGSSTSFVGFQPLDEEGARSEIPEAFRAKAEKRASRTLARGVGFVSVLFGIGSGLGGIWILILGAVAGLTIGLILTIWPGVEFTARRSERIFRFGLKGLVAPLAGAAGTVILRALSEGKLH